MRVGQILEVQVSGPEPVSVIDNGRTWEVAPFWDGGIHRARFLPLEPGEYQFGGERFQVEDDPSFRGILRASGTHFEWSRTGEAWFWNSTTAYMLAGLEESVALQAIDRLAGLGVNRLRVALCPSRQLDGNRWMEPNVGERDDFAFCYGPWKAARPTDALDPGFLVDQFDFDYWAKFERLLSHAAEQGVIFQVIFFVDAQEPQNYPFDRERLGDDPDEQAYYAYAAARLAAFWNVEWCVTNEWALFRPDEWVEAVGARLATLDPYGHLLSVHGHGHFPFRESAWCTHELYQIWDDHGAYDWARRTRGTKPLVNEEFGYEDHYPFPWGEGRVAPARDADSRARQAWELFFAGAFCTTGEEAGSGLGGWINGLASRPDLLDRHRHLKTFAESFEWAGTQPLDGVATGYTRVRGLEGQVYAIYLYGGGGARVNLPDLGPWTVEEFDPRTGARRRLVGAQNLEVDPYSGPGWIVPHRPYGEDWAFLIRRGEVTL